MRSPLSTIFFFFFFNDTATTEIYTLSLHDALPIFDPTGRAASGPDLALAQPAPPPARPELGREHPERARPRALPLDRKSTRLNSSHLVISYAVFCLKKKKSISHAIRSLCEPPYINA